MIKMIHITFGEAKDIMSEELRKNPSLVQTYIGNLTGSFASGTVLNQEYCEHLAKLALTSIFGNIWDETHLKKETFVDKDGKSVEIETPIVKRCLTCMNWKPSEEDNWGYCRNKNGEGRAGSNDCQEWEPRR